VNRRGFAAFVLTGLALPGLARAQGQAQKKTTMVVLFPGDSEDDEPAARHFFDEMRRRGWSEGVNMAYERLSGRGTRKYLESLAGVASGIDPHLVLATTTSLALAVVKENPKVPVVFISAADPVTAGLVETHAKPGRSATGVHLVQAADAVEQSLAFARQAEPKLKRIGVLFDRHTTEHERIKANFSAAAARAKLEVVPVEFSNFEAVLKALVTLRKDNIGIVAVGPSLTLLARRKEVVAQAMRNSIGLITRRSEWPEAGALLSYGTELAESQRRAAAIADRVLKGAAPAGIPVERSMKMELVLNHKTARTLGLGFPRELLLRADRVID
jgi:putative ABC transport system substrate-binding protein